MERREQIRRAEVFRSMHEGRRILLLPNTWDVVSAKVYEREGFRAIGTTSAGIAASLGYADGQRMSLEENLMVCRRIANAVRVPVSVDLEAGYASCLDGLRHSIAAALECGAAGINLEDSAKAGCGGGGADGLVDVDVQCERIAAARDAAARLGVPIFINARTDVYLGHGEPTADSLAAAIERGRAYRRAGADCVFVPDMGALGEREIGSLAREIGAPLNLIAGARTPDVARLEQLGVARLSFGPRPMRATLHFLQVMAREWIATGTYARLTSSGSVSYNEINEWFAPGDERNDRAQ